MASRRRSSSPENPLNFYIVIHSGNIRRISIPKMFTEKHGKKLLERVILKVPNGDVWQVDLKKSKNGIWLQNGWTEFAEHYSLSSGGFVVFKYEGYSIFSVIILDLTSSEIIYPDKRDWPQKFAQENTRKSPVSCKKVNFSAVKTEESTDETLSSWTKDEETGAEINDWGECSSKMQRKQGICQDEKNRALETAEAKFKSERPFFMVYMNQSYVRGTHGPHIPKKYWKENESNLKECLLKIKNGDKTWEVATHSNGTFGLVGWKEFAKDNLISLGDVCVFENIQQHPTRFDVTLFKHTTLF